MRLISLCDVCQQQREESCCYQHDGFGDLHCLNIIRKYLEVRKYHQAPAKLEASNCYLPSGRNNAHRNLPLSGPLSTTDIFHTRNKKKKFSIFFQEFDSIFILSCLKSDNFEFEFDFNNRHFTLLTVSV